MRRPPAGAGRSRQAARAGACRGSDPWPRREGVGAATLEASVTPSTAGSADPTGAPGPPEGTARPHDDPTQTRIPASPDRPVARSARHSHPTGGYARAGRTADMTTMDGLQAGGAAADGQSGPAADGQDPSAQRLPPGPTPPAGRSWRHRPPTRSTRPGGSRHAGWPLRVVVLAAGAALLLTVLVVAVLPPLGRLADESARLGVAVSAWGAVTEAKTANAEGEAALLAMVAETAPAEQAALLGQSMERGQYARGLMDKSAQPADPATAGLRTRLNTDWTTATGLSTALASARIRAGGSAPLPAGMVSAQFRAYQAVNADLAALAQHYQQVVTDLAGQLNAETAHTRGRLLLVYGCGLGLLALLLIPGLRHARRWAAQDRRRAAQATSADVETRVRRAYEMADSEAEALAVTAPRADRGAGRAPQPAAARRLQPRAPDLAARHRPGRPVLFTGHPRPLPGGRPRAAMRVPRQQHPRRLPPAAGGPRPGGGQLRADQRRRPLGRGAPTHRARSPRGPPAARTPPPPSS